MLEVLTAISKLQHKPSVAHFDMSFTALSIGPCGRLPHNLKGFLDVGDCFRLCFKLAVSLQHCTPHVIVHWVYIGQIWRSLVFVMKSGQLARSPFRALRAVCADALSCWKMNPVGSRRLL